MDCRLGGSAEDTESGALCPDIQRLVEVVVVRCSGYFVRSLLASSKFPQSLIQSPWWTVIRGVDLRSIEDTAVIELFLTRPERKVER